MKTFDHDFCSIHYPENYSVDLDENQRVIIIGGEKGRVEIFRSSDFGERIHGFSSSGMEEYECKLVPKEKTRKGELEIWLFYHRDDNSTKDELRDLLTLIIPKK